MSKYAAYLKSNMKIIFNGTWLFLFSLISPHLPRMMPRHWLAAVWRDFLSRKNFLVEITQKISAEKTRLGPALRLVHFTRVAIPNFFGVDSCWIDLLCQVWFYKKLKIRKSPVPVFTKGQLISEWNFGVFKSPQKPTKFLISALASQGRNLLYIWLAFWEQ